MSEVWMPVVGYEENYQISTYGNIKSSSKVLKPYKRADGYLKVTLCNDGKRKDYYVHRIVALVYLGQSDLQVNHKDGNRSNNSASNLEYVTVRENVTHGKRRDKGYTGVYQTRTGSWLVRPWLNGQQINLGTHKMESKARSLYQEFLIKNNEVNKYAVE